MRFQEDSMVIQAAGRRLEQKAEENLHMLQQLEAELDSLGMVWTGEDRDLYQFLFRTEIRNMRILAESLRTEAVLIRKAGYYYESCEKTLLQELGGIG